MDRLRFGILGVSRIAQKAILPAFTSSKKAELVCIGSRAHTHLDLGFPMLSYEDVLASDIDAVYLSLPNSLHEEWSIKAAQAGKHIWCEKPAALTYSSAQRMTETARTHNVRLMEGFMFLRHPQHAEVRELIESGEIGEVVGFEGRFAFPFPDKGNIRLDPARGGGVYADAFGYPLRASRLFLGEPTHITNRLYVNEEFGVDVKAESTLHFKDVNATLSAEFTTDYRSTYRIQGTTGSVSMERAYAVPADMETHVFVERHGVAETIAIPPSDQFMLMIDEFAEEVLSGTTKKNYEEDLLQQARILDAGRLSAAEHKTIKISTE